MPAFPNLEKPVYTSSGVPFEFIFEDYKEQFVVRGSNSFIKARVAFEDAGDFLHDILGGTTGMSGGNYYQRTLPLEHPMIENLWCNDATLLAYPSSDGTNANADDMLGFGGFTTDWAIYGLTFVRMPYLVLEDDDVSGFDIPELGRFCIVGYRPRAREFTVGAYGLKPEGDPDDTNLLPLPAFIMDKEQDLIVQQLQVPTELVPYTEIDACLGAINDADIDIVIPPGQAGGLSTLRTFPTKTLLFRGLATDVTDYSKAIGPGKYTDLPFFFTYRPNGWRKLPKPDGTGAYTTYVYNRISPTKYMYETATFSKLFKPTP